MAKPAAAQPKRKVARPKSAREAEEERALSKKPSASRSSTTTAAR